jgi:hypothetical protein
MQSLKVTAIRRYKTKEHVENEYLIAEVSAPDLGCRRYVRIERGRTRCYCHPGNYHDSKIYDLVTSME